MKECRIASSVFDPFDQSMMLAEIKGLIDNRRQFAVSFDKYGTATVSAPPEQANQPSVA